MEIMYSDKTTSYFKQSTIVGFYKDSRDLLDYIESFYGISYDDEWNVKKFLNGSRFKLDENVIEGLKKFGLKEDILEKKIKILSTNEFKLVLLTYIYLLNPLVYIFDYFDIGLSYKNRKMFINFLKELKLKEKSVIVITNDIGFIYEVSDNVMILENKKLVFNGSKNDLFVTKRINEYPPIIDFIRKANKKGANLLYTMDTKELLKDIYRSLK